MKKLILAAVALTMAMSAFAQTGTGADMKRKSSGDSLEDRVWYMMDNTLNAAEEDSLRTLFRRGNNAHIIMKAIANGVDNVGKDKGWSSSSMWNTNMNSMDVITEGAAWDAMDKGLSWEETGALHSVMARMGESEMHAIYKVVRDGWWASNRWQSMHGSGS